MLLLTIKENLYIIFAYNTGKIPKKERANMKTTRFFYYYFTVADKASFGKTLY